MNHSSISKVNKHFTLGTIMALTLFTTPAAIADILSCIPNEKGITCKQNGKKISIKNGEHITISGCTISISRNGDINTDCKNGNDIRIEIPDSNDNRAINQNNKGGSNIMIIR